MNKWLFILPVTGALGIGALGAGYDGVMGPARAERDFVKQCTNQMFGQGVSLSDAEDTCACIADKTAAARESGAGEIGKAEFDRVSRACVSAHVRPEMMYSVRSRSSSGEEEEDLGWGRN